MESFQRFLLFAPVILFSMVAHEVAHAYAALKQGDDTAQSLGRITWNPIKHIDPIMTILMPILTWFGSKGTFIFGGAKPVPVDPRKYRQLRRGDIIVSLAGIVANLALALLLVLLFAVFGLLGRVIPGAESTLALLQRLCSFGLFFNLLLAVFNLLPVPPLDGSHVMKWLLPAAWSIRYQQLYRVGFLLVLILVTVGRPVIEFWMSPVLFAYRAAAEALFPLSLPGAWTL